MVFSSTTFLLLFLPVTLLAAFPLRRVWQNAALLVLSLVFYIWGAGAEIWIILLVAAVSWLAARLIANLEGQARHTAFIVALVPLLLPLLVLKYWPVILAERAGVDAVIVLPLGISFFTFHALSYVIDVHQRRISVERRPDDYGLYLFLFPHQIAGPIVRYRELVDEIKGRGRAADPAVAYGVARFAWGLAKKVLVADQAGAVADAVWRTLDLPNPPGGATATAAWLGAFAYSTQIYFDFSGYSDMAIGLARIFNFHFPENFNGPYRAASAAEFWQRWHMTLSRWFRDYVYIPLGGNRHGRIREYVALVVTFLVTALWHGATRPFLIWGALWSTALLLERITGLRTVSSRWRSLRRALFLIFLWWSWVPFRSGRLIDLWRMWHAMGRGAWTWPSPDVLVVLTPFRLLALVAGAVVCVMPLSLGRTIDAIVLAGDRVRVRQATLVAAGAGAIAVALAIFSNGTSPFLYFQF